jgi:hypothetical protein
MLDNENPLGRLSLGLAIEGCILLSHPDEVVFLTYNV